MDKRVLEVLRIIHDRLKYKKIRWCLMGSTSLLVHGIVENVGDIDILTDKEGAFRICNLLGEYMVKQPAFSKTEKFASYFGILKIAGMKVEVAGDFAEKLEGKWVNLSRARLDRRQFKTIDGMRFPVSPLTMHLESYRGLKRKKDIVKIKKLEERLRK